MEERQAIRRQGDGAESRFLDLVDTARPSDNAKLGDAIVSVDGKNHYVEVKECHAAIGKSGTINQVRAIKYITCVVWAPNHGYWYVMSPGQLVRLAATKIRGQHTEIPFECMNFSLATLPKEYHSKSTDTDLKISVERAIREGASNGELESLMANLLEEIVALKERFIEAVREADAPNT